MPCQLVSRRVEDDDLVDLSGLQPNELRARVIDEDRGRILAEDVVPRTLALGPSLLDSTLDVSTQTLEVPALSGGAQRSSFALDHEGRTLKDHKTVELGALVEEVDESAA